MPASNMPKDGGTGTNGMPVIMNPFSGPTGSPLDAKSYNGGGTLVGDTTNYSTGAMNTGIGFGANHVLSSISGSGFTDSVIVGVTMPDGTTAAADATLIAIGGGSSAAASGGVAETTPILVQPILNFGGGAARDAGSSPYTGFETKLVTASITVTAGSAIEAGFLNRTGVTMVAGQSAMGISNTASADITPVISGDDTPAVSSPDLPVDTYTVLPLASTWAISGGADADLFEITDGDLAFIAASVNGTYNVTISATNGGFQDTLPIVVTVS